MPPMGSKEKVTELGWKTKRVLSAAVGQGKPQEGEGCYQSIGRLSAAAAEGNGRTSLVFCKETQKCCFRTTHTREEAELP